MTSVEDDSLVNTIESEILRVENDLKGVDEKMRRLTGWDSFGDNRPRERRQRLSSLSKDDEPPAKRKSFSGVFARLGGAVLDGRREPRGRENGDRGPFRGGRGDAGGFRDKGRRMEEPLEMMEDDNTPKPSVPSSVIRPVIDMKSRTEAAAELTKDRASRDRNRRMFGALIGTLQRFRNDEAKQKDKDEQRAAIDRKLEEKGKAEQEVIRRERQQLFRRKKEDQAQIHRLKMKMARLKEHEKWVEHQMSLTRFIRTKTKPQIFWLPKIPNSKTTRLTSSTKEMIEGEVEDQKLHLKEELEQLVGKGHNLEDQRDEGSDLEEGEDDDESSEHVVMSAGRANRHRGMLGTKRLQEHSQDMLDYEAEEGELVYDKSDLIVKTGKNDSSGKRMVVQVASSIGGKGGQRRVVELVSEPMEGRKRKISRRNDSDDEELGRIKIGKVAGEALDRGRHEREGRAERSKHKKEEKRRHKEEKEKRRRKSSESKSPQKDKDLKKKKKEINGKHSENTVNIEDDFMDDLPPLPNDPVLDLGMGESEEEDESLVNSAKNGSDITISIKQEKADKSSDNSKQVSRVVSNKDVKQERGLNTSNKTDTATNREQESNSSDTHKTQHEEAVLPITEPEVIKPKVRARWDVKEKVVVTEIIPPEPEITSSKVTNSSSKINEKALPVTKDFDNKSQSEQGKDSISDQEESTKEKQKDKKSSEEIELDSHKTHSTKTKHSTDSKKSKNEKSDAALSKEKEETGRSRDKQRSSSRKRSKREHKKSVSSSPTKRRRRRSSDRDRSDSSSGKESVGSRSSYTERSSSGTESSTGTSDSETDSSSSSASSSGHDSSKDSKTKKLKSLSSRNRQSYRKKVSESNSNSESEDEDKKQSRKSVSSSSRKTDDRHKKSKERDEKSQSKSNKGDSRSDSKHNDDRKKRSRTRSHSRDRKRTNDRKRKH